VYRIFGRASLAGRVCLCRLWRTFRLSRPGSLMRLRARRGLPGSGALLSNVMWPSTPAGRQHLRIRGPAHIAFGSGECLSPRSVSISRLNLTPHSIAMYASSWSSPSTPQHSLPGGRYSLPGPDLHRLDRASFAWRTTTNSRSPAIDPPSGRRGYATLRRGAGHQNIS
jgi:hypothetical protein